MGTESKNLGDSRDYNWLRRDETEFRIRTESGRAGAPFPRSELGPCRTSTAGAGMQVMRHLPEKKGKKEIKKNPRCICLAACVNLAVLSWVAARSDADNHWRGSVKEL